MRKKRPSKLVQSLVQLHRTPALVVFLPCLMGEHRERRNPSRPLWDHWRGEVYRSTSQAQAKSIMELAEASQKTSDFRGAGTETRPVAVCLCDELATRVAGSETKQAKRPALLSLLSH